MLAAANANASLEEIRKRSEEDKAVWQREREELQQQVNRLQEEVLAAANANASLEEIRVQQNDHINKLLNAEKMRTKQGTSELVAEMPPSKKQKQDMPGKACDTDSFFKQIAGLSRQGDEAAIVQGMLTHSEHACVQQACFVQGMLTHSVSMKALRGACAWICGNVTVYVIPAVSRASVALEDCQKWAMVNQQCTYAQANMQQEWMERWAVARKEWERRHRAVGGVCNRLTKKRLRGFVIAYTQMCEILAEGNSDPLAYEAIREELHGILVDVCTSVLGAEHACEALRKRAQRRRIEYTNFSVVLRDLTNLKPPGRKVFTGSGGEAAFIGHRRMR
jgi:hypothetical protein